MILQQLINDTNKVYDAMQDNLSRYLFQQFISYTLTTDITLLQCVYHTIFANKIPKKPVVCFGGGAFITRIQSYIDEYGMDIIDVIDNNPKVNFLKIPVLNAVDYLNKRLQNNNINDVIYFLNVSVNGSFIMQMKKQLAEFGVKNDHIFDYSDLFKYAVNTDMTPLMENSSLPIEQYFDLPELNLTDSEVFVDAGVFNGFSSISFAKKVNRKYKAIYAFEPDFQSFERSKRRLADDNLNANLIPKGLWDKTETLLLKEHPTGDSTIVADNKEGKTVKIESISLDEFFADKAREDKPTFIKMDIEGAELKALMGTKQIIIEHKPKLAVCVYHKPEDLFTIPQLLLKFNKKYRIYLRKYPSKLAAELVMYFI